MANFLTYFDRLGADDDLSIDPQFIAASENARKFLRAYSISKRKDKVHANHLPRERWVDHAQQAVDDLQRLPLTSQCNEADLVDVVVGIHSRDFKSWEHLTWGQASPIFLTSWDDELGKNENSEGNDDSQHHNLFTSSLHRSLSMTELSRPFVPLEDQIDAVSGMILAWSNHRDRMAATGDGRLNVRTVGRGCEAVITVHGICMTGTFYAEGLLTYCSPECLEAFTFYAPDLMGYGKSRGVLPDENYSLGEQVDALVRDVLDRFNLKSFHLVGHSYGGLCVIDLASRFPERVRSLTLLSPAYFETDQQAYQLLKEVPIPARWVVAYPELGRPLIGTLNQSAKYLFPIIRKLIPGSELPAAALLDFFSQEPDATVGTINTIGWYDGVR
eukprot:GHVN01008179.1.p1 GENE.GHVN01008179.1~~GHVN01008179.1.p1  ORF type:complete len:387 (+),score=63.17 GHVN01008179.1:41-1201(+)